LAESLLNAEGRRSGASLGLGWFTILLLVFTASAVMLVIDVVVNWPLAPTLLNIGGMWTGRDFVAFWAASDLALHGQAAQAYDYARIHAVEISAVGGDVRMTAWAYPPPALLLVYPLALLSYPVALAVWLLLPLVGLALLLRRLAPHPLTPWLAPLFTGISQSLGIGQNGVLSALMLGAGLLALDRKPLLAGCCFGLLACKPQLAILVGPALLVGGHYRALAAMAATVLILALASWIAFGTSTWEAFFKNLPVITSWLADGSLPYALMTTVFAAARLAGVSAANAYALQWLSTIGALVVVVWIWRRPLPLWLRGSALAAAIPMATPYAYSYDLALLSLPLAWLTWDALTRAWRRVDGVVLMLTWLAPAGGWLLADSTKVLVTPLILALLLAVITRRAMEQRGFAAAVDAITP
jgi:glycosyl transferase family 87